MLMAVEAGGWVHEIPSHSLVLGSFTKFNNKIFKMVIVTSVHCNHYNNAKMYKENIVKFSLPSLQSKSSTA